MAMRAALALLAALAGACQIPEVEPATDFVVADPVLAVELREAAAMWAAAGLEVAGYVTVNQTDDGVPVAALPRVELRESCYPASPERVDEHHADGCVEHAESGVDFEGLWIADDLSAERRVVVLAHELIHLIVPDAEHLPNESGGIFTVGGVSSFVTIGDLREMARHTTVTPVSQ